MQKILIDNVSLMVNSFDKKYYDKVSPEYIANALKEKLLLCKKAKRSRLIFSKCPIYCFKYNNKKYYYERLSNKDIHDLDAVNIKNSNLGPFGIMTKALEITGSHQIINPKFIYGVIDGGHSALVEYTKNKKRYIIDVELDLIMESNDYRELFNLEEVITLDINQVYYLSEINKLLKEEVPLVFFMLFYDAVIPKLSKLMGYSDSKFDNDGININNASIVYNGCDGIFKDINNKMMISEFYELNDITLRPSYYNCFSDFNGGYIFKKYSFYLYSDTIDNEEAKKELLSTERFGICHYINPRVALSLREFVSRENEKREIYIVSGIVYYKSKRYVYHTWIELETKKKGKYKVIDYTQNIVMPKEKFYEYATPKVLERVSIEDYIYLHELLKSFGMNFSYRLQDLFATDFIRDFEKNKSLIRN